MATGSGTRAAVLEHRNHTNIGLSNHKVRLAFAGFSLLRLMGLEIALRQEEEQEEEWVGGCGGGEEARCAALRCYIDCVGEGGRTGSVVRLVGLWPWRGWRVRAERPLLWD